jgi:peptide/nickel transport system permease protein
MSMSQLPIQREQQVSGRWLRLQRQGWIGRAWRILAADPATLISLCVIMVVGLIALLAPWITPYDPLASRPSMRFQPPSLAHPFGTDHFGRDVLSRTIAAARLDLGIALVSVTAAFAVGTLLGAVSGYLGGWIDDLLMRLIDIILSFPMLVLAMALAVFLGSGVAVVVLVTIVINVPLFARLMRGEMLSRRSLDYVDAAVCSGNSTLRVIFYHLYPNCWGPVIIQGTLNLAWAILNTAALSFIGLGVKPPTPEWGTMIAEGARFIVNGAWWMSFFPGLCVTITVLAFNIFGDGLQDLLDPQRQR